ncbi:hypothetical protein K1T71_014506 [Dendrolimus kikuchii]|uniref:Uncharacterized protein n=1 Tax=Dendrolimus kikuchii TaxID=765133 RepID=A0ACC1CEI3_9NEOP|nr:hypothetical protein K1T71_014506 [Dendrolimus kikuchii]
MSVPAGSEYYAITLVWLVLCCIYTTLLSITAFCVVYIFRKRRSSILKSQRPPRTPFSELEFNVATPTDTVKSRRVSFSKRTGVAEFVTNEATTTWKNFYEEHNKSMESSGNDSEMHPARAVVSLGKKIFDQQFEEVEAIDLITTMDNRSGLNMNHSIQNVNFAPFEMTAASLDKLTAPKTKFELSTFTDHQSKVFGDDLALTNMEVTEGMNINFSNVQPLSEGDDLDEIEKDIGRVQSNVICHGPFNMRDMSGYIEVDLNMTHVVMREDESDMSITNSVHIPKVDDLSKSITLDKNESNKDWLVDKENIAINPYVTPRETDNFAINREYDKVLVFDGKRLTLQSEKEELKSNRHTMLPNPITIKDHRKTITLNINDDLPNFFDENEALNSENISHVVPSKTIQKHNMSIINDTKLQTVLYDEGVDISMTQALPTNIAIHEKQRTIVFGKDNGNISITQAVPVSKIVFDNDANISLTEAVPSNIILNIENNAYAAVIEGSNAMSSNIKNDWIDNKKTIVYESNDNISITQAALGSILPPNLKAARRQTVVFDDDGNIQSISEVVNGLPDSIQNNKRQTMLISDDGNMSMTQAIPNKIISQEQFDKSNNNTKLVMVNELTYTKNNKRQTIVFDGDISITQALPTNILNTDVSIIITDKSIRTQLMTYEDNTQNISKKEVLPSKVILKDNSTVKQDNNCNISMATSIADNAGQSGRYKNQCAIGNQGNDDLSLDSELPCNFMLLKDNSYKNLSQEKCYKPNKIQSDNTIGRTSGLTSINMLVNGVSNSQVIVDGNDDGLEVDQQRLLFNQSKYVENISNISKTVKNHAHISNKISNCQEIVGGDRETKRNSSVYISEVSVNLECDISMTKNLSDGIQTYKCNNESQIELITINNSPKKEIERNCTEHKTTVNQYFKKHVNPKVYTLDDCIKTAVKPIPMELSTTQDKIIKSEGNKVDSTEMEPIHQNVFVYQSFTNSVSQLQLTRTEQGDVKSDRTLNQCDEQPNSSTIVIEKDDIKSNVDADKKSISKTKISTITFNKEEEDVEMADIDKPVSILDELLDMSTASSEGGLDDKYCTAKVETPHDSVVSMKKPNVDNTSNESMFYITRDSDEEAQTEMSRKGFKGIDTRNIDTSPLPLEYKEQQPCILEDVPEKLEKVKSVSYDSKNSSPQNRHYEKVVSSDINIEDKKLNERLSIAGRSFKTADDTNDLLKLLSDFTDKKGSDYIEEEDEEQQEPIVVKGHIAIENKSELEPKHLSIVPNRQSIVISREDLLNNISMAHATLQKSRYELDLSESIEDTKESLEESCHKKSVRISSEVVKALHFDDDTTSELSVKSELKLSPLKKTAFGETSYMKETKANVIPTYLKDVSDNIKALMSDLVKPVQDVMPFEVGKSDKGIRRSNSTCSTQVQANLITSSQIDLESNINSEHQSPQQIDSTNSLINGIANSGNQAIEHALKSALKLSRPVEKYSDIGVESADESFNQLSVGRPTSGQYVSDRVLIFDHNNPLNNVLLAPADLTEVHRYNPKKSTETICFSERSHSAQISVHDTENEHNADRVSAQYLVKTSYIVKQGGDTCRDSPVDTSSIASNISKPMSIDESTDVKPIDVKHTQVNTMIAMKGTKQLLEASSSLTLVDDALARPEFEINVDTNSSSQDNVYSKNLQNPVKTIFKNDVGDNTHKVESDIITSNDEETEPMQLRTKKRVYSPANIDKHKNCTLSSLDLTPRPFSKMQKISETPRQLENNDIDERPVKEPKVKKSASKPIQERKTSPKKKNKKPGTSVTVQQLLTEYNMQVDEDTSVKSESLIPITISKSDEEGRSVDMISSFTSSKNLNEINNRSVSNTVSNTVSTISKCSKNSRVEWQPELGDDSSKNQIAECDASVNVVAKIDMLPFMGSQECEWESCSGDTWCFRLLHSRLRLAVRLAHRHENAARTRVAAHTPVLAVTVHIAHQDRSNSVASVCVRFAAEAMRYLAGGACAAAGEVPALLRRCRAVARVALRWGRAMHDARARLAYTLTADGQLALKVANVALRSVWEVTMRLELVVDEAKEAPWPRAADVRVARVVSDYEVSEDEVHRALRHVPHDWGHVPRTVWRIFKYLKHKTRSDELLDV